MTRLDAIAARLEAAVGKPLDVTIHADRPMVTVQTSPEVWDLIRGALSADVVDLLAVVREVAALHKPYDRPRLGAGPDYPVIHEQACEVCVADGEYGDDTRMETYPCPTATALNRLEEA